MVKKKKVIKKPITKKRVDVSKKKFNIIIRNLILFAILFILSLVLYSVSEKEIFTNFFFLFLVIFGFIFLAFLIVLLVFVFLRLLRK